MGRKPRKQWGKLIRGMLRVNSRGVGFIEDERQGEDVMIETEHLATALNRDEVEVELLKGRVRGRRTGRVVRIVKRAKMRFVGTIEEHGTKLVLIPDDFRMYAPIILNSPFRKGSTEPFSERAREGFKSSFDSLRRIKSGGQLHSRCRV